MRKSRVRENLLKGISIQEATEQEVKSFDLKGLSPSPASPLCVEHGLLITVLGLSS